LKESYVEREASYNEQTSQLTADVDKLHALLDEAKLKLENGNKVSTNFHLNKEINTLSKQLAAKGEEITKLRNLYINEKHGER
jgi:predicted  nucleic acid-binding Zn-ribbon protein